MLEFWQDVVGLPYEEALPTGGGNVQHRHGLNGGVLKLNHVRAPMPESAAAGYHELLIAREGIEDPRQLGDPDGNRVTLVPMGHRGISTMGVLILVRNLAAAGRYYGESLGFESSAANSYRCGESLILLGADASRVVGAPMRGKGYRYLTAQVWDCDSEMAGIAERGGTVAAPPRTMGAVARFGFVNDPDGNWLEISQRASLTGPLPQN